MADPEYTQHGLFDPPPTQAVTIHRAYRYELDLNNEQMTKCFQFAGVARWAYNYGLQKKIEARAVGAKPPTAFDIGKEIVRLKHTTHPWLRDVSKSVPQAALANLDRAFANLFDPQMKVKHPKFKSRKNGIGGFRLTSITIRAIDKTVTLPRLGTLRTKHETAVEGRILSATVKERAGRWFVTFCVEKDIAVPVNDGPPIGVDLGITTLATMSDGTTCENPKALGTKLKKLRRLQRSLCRRQKGSKRREKMKQRIATLHYRIANVRSDTLHKLTSRLAKNHGAIGIEDLNVLGLVKNHSLARAISDCGWGEFRRQLEYKCLWYGSTLIVHDRFFPSSKTCSRCGHVQDVLPLSQRIYRCEKCGLVIDRDLNAALNLEPGGTRLQDVEGEALASEQSEVKPSPKKRQPSVVSRKASE